MTKNSFQTVPFFVAASLLAGCAAPDELPSEDVATADAELHAASCPEDVPAALKPPADQTIKFVLPAVGVQIYLCSATATGFAWAFIAPQANLLNDHDRLVGTHFIGPTWQGNDGSSVVAARVAGATVEPSAIPWLLLTATSHSPSAGRFADVTTIQRVNTVGGIAPTSPCDASNLGSIAQVPYTTDYVFYRTKSRGRVIQCGGG